MYPLHWKRGEFPEPIRELIRQREELRRQRRELVDQLYDTIAELEGRPVRRPDIGFPFNLIVRFIRRALNVLEALVQRGLAALINKQ